MKRSTELNKTKVRIAVVQMNVELHNPETNLKKIESFIKEASTSAGIVVFPEDCVTGPIMENNELTDCDKKYLRLFQKWAKKYGIDIVTGSFIEGTKTGNYNTTYYIDNKGKVRGKYRKINLWHPERPYLTSGNEISVFNTRFGKVGLCVCWDLISSSMFRKMLSQGVEIVFCPSYWTIQDGGKIVEKYNKHGEIETIDSLCKARSVENNIVLIYSNFAGKLRYKNIDQDSCGVSQITVPWIGHLKRLKHNREEMFIEEIDLNILKDSERVYKIRKDIKSKIF